mmetsp:Transcript_4635/g.6232  ORF Transcript_4635/g.6232 Transcript_4635/m.6232 type:complete len:317 (-) Transcript_4635:1158-2108(-)
MSQCPVGDHFLELLPVQEILLWLSAAKIQPGLACGLALLLFECSTSCLEESTKWRHSRPRTDHDHGGVKNVRRWVESATLLKKDGHFGSGLKIGFETPFAQPRKIVQPVGSDACPWEPSGRGEVDHAESHLDGGGVLFLTRCEGVVSRGQSRQGVQQVSKRRAARREHVEELQQRRASLLDLLVIHFLAPSGRQLQQPVLLALVFGVLGQRAEHGLPGRRRDVAVVLQTPLRSEGDSRQREVGEEEGTGGPCRLTCGGHHIQGGERREAQAGKERLHLSLRVLRQDSDTVARLVHCPAVSNVQTQMQHSTVRGGGS